jgi:isoleucyl-tRNA synthetase
MAKAIGSSLQAAVNLNFDAGHVDARLLGEAEWAEILIVSSVTVRELGPEFTTDAATHVPLHQVTTAPGTKCARCWRVLPEVGASAAHPTLCLRCEDAVEALS